MGGNFCTKWESKFSQDSVLDSSVHKYLYRSCMSGPSLLYITQSINTYIDPVCPDRLTLRYCSCKTYLLHRRAELKAAPGSTWLMRNWTFGNNEPLAVPTYIPGVISCCISYVRKRLTFDCFDKLVFLTNIICEYFSHNSQSISYRAVSV